MSEQKYRTVYGPGRNVTRVPDEPKPEPKKKSDEKDPKTGDPKAGDGK